MSDRDTVRERMSDERADEIDQALRHKQNKPTKYRPDRPPKPPRPEQAEGPDRRERPQIKKDGEKEEDDI